jgi:hypothetical protein
MRAGLPNVASASQSVRLTSAPLLIREHHTTAPSWCRPECVVTEGRSVGRSGRVVHSKRSVACIRETCSVACLTSRAYRCLLHIVDNGSVASENLRCAKMEINYRGKARQVTPHTVLAHVSTASCRSALCSVESQA